MERIVLRSDPVNHFEPWPLVRLLTVFGAMGAWAHWRFAWNMPAPVVIRAAALGMIGLFLFCGLLSVTLARMYLALVLFPLYATTALNTWLYDGSYWVFRTALRLLYMRRVSAVVALAGEVGIFVGLCRLIELLAKRYVL